MAGLNATWHYDECLHFPRGAIRFPIELRTPVRFEPEQPATWPQIPGRLEFVDGRLTYMPPCGDLQQDVCVDVVSVLAAWVREHREFVVGANEAGMILGGDIRAADAAVWLRSALGGHSGKFRRAAPILAVEVAGTDEGETELLAKAEWYRRNGVRWVWIVLPEAREVVVCGGTNPLRLGAGMAISEVADLPNLAPAVADLFQQVSL